MHTPVMPESHATALRAFHLESIHRNIDKSRALVLDLETGWPKANFVKFWVILFFEGDHYILRLDPPIPLLK